MRLGHFNPRGERFSFEGDIESFICQPDGSHFADHSVPTRRRGRVAEVRDGWQIGIGRRARHVLSGIGSTAACALLASLVLGFFATPSTAQESDDFNHCVPDPMIWSFVDPIGDSSATISGVGGVDPKLAIHVPAGTSHNPWTINTAARLLQPASDTDFSVEAKFDSVFDAQYQMQGILVEEASDVFLRFEFHYTVAGYRGFVSRVDGGAANMITLAPLGEEPRYMRVTRTGDDWDVEWAGASQSFMPLASFNSALVVTAMGPYAGNFAPIAPEFTALVDYFDVAGSPFLAPDGAPIPQDRSLTLSPSANGTILASPAQAFYSCDQIVSLDAAADPGFTFAGWTGDLAGALSPDSISMNVDRTVGATFTPNPGVPVISGIDISAGADEIRVQWNTDVPSTSRVEWGLTTSYELGVLDDANLVVGHDLVIPGLTPNTPYHVRISSTSVDVNETISGDYPVTTALDPLNVPSGFFSDDFNACELDPSLWTVYDPLGDSMVSIVGAGTSDAQLSLSIPPGTPHEPWIINESVRALQPVADTDLSVELKFDSVVTQGYQIQGLTVQSTPSHYLRFDFYSTGSTQKAFAAIFENGTATSIVNTSITADQYLRVSRSGDLWVFDRSSDGNSWTNVDTFIHSMVVTEVGPHAGTDIKGGTVPAIDVRVDYAMTTLSPIASEDLGVLPADKTLNVSVVGAGSVAVMPDKPAYSCGEVVSLTATPATGNLFSGWTGDLASAVNPESLVMSGDVQITASFNLIPEPPGLSNVQVSTDSVQESATVSWSTLAITDGVVEYGTTAGYELGSVATSAPSQNHSVLLNNLTPGIEYHFRVVATTPTGGNEASSDATFTIPFLPGQDPSGILTEDFNTCALDTRLWRVRDPQGDGVVSIQGAGTGDAALVLSVPAGIEHDPWIGDTSLSVLQPANNTNFSLEAKFDSLVNVALQLQGVVAKESDSRFMRFGIYYDGIETRALIAQINESNASVLVDVPVIGTAPFLVQVVRLGDTWDYYVAGDGGGFSLVGSVTESVVVNEVGVYSGNAGASEPAHTAVIDYFRNLSFPLTDEDLGTPPATVTLDTNVSGMGSVSVDPVGSPYTCGTQVAIQANPMLGYEFVSWSGDSSASVAALDLTLVEDTSLTATFQVDTSPPVLDGFSVIAGPDGAEIRIAANELANYRIRYGLTSQYELGMITSSQPDTEHVAVITGLVAASVYHFDIELEDLALITTTSTDQTFTTSGPPGSGPAGLFSDDFNSCAVDSGLWTVTDPLQDASFTITGAGAGDARLEISVPGGSDHEPWGFNNAPRLIQPIANADFEVEVRFDSPVTQKYQEQGILVEVDAGHYLRFDFYSNGVDNFAFAGYVESTGETSIGSQKIPASDTMLMRILRVGDDWTQSYSFDGINWFIANQFNQVFAPTGVGVFAGNSGGSTAPAHTAVIDYFSAVSSPAVPEDFGAVGGTKTLTVNPSGPGTVVLDPDQTEFACGESVTLNAVPDLGFAFDGWSGDLTGTDNPEVLGMTDHRNVTASFSLDTTPPIITDVDVARGPTSVIVNWRTNEPTTSRVLYGVTTSYELGSVDSSVFTKDHTTVISGLDPIQTYHLEIEVTDGASFQTLSGDLLVGPAEGPIINVFYGSSQEYGTQGLSQPMFNLLGNASDPDGVATITWSLNGGPDRVLSMGPDTRRLLNAGDFNAEIFANTLNPGTNSVVIRSTDSFGNLSVEPMTLNYTPGSIPSLPMSVDWTSASSIQPEGQVADGEWVLQAGGLRSIVKGYDRTVAIGDVSWTDYEVVARVSVNEVDPLFASPSNGALIAVIARWIGHTPDGRQPADQWYPFGGFATYTFKDGNGGPIKEFKQLHGDKSVVHGSDSQSTPIELGVPYVMKVRVETLPNGSTQYDFKMWKESDGEPPAWDMSGVELAGEDVPSGSVLLVSHHVDATWHDVVISPIVPVQPDTTPPNAPMEFFVVPLSDSSVELSWTAVLDDQAMGSYSVYRDGALVASGLTTAQYVDSGLSDMTQYDYTVIATDAAGNSSAPSNIFSITTLALGAPAWLDPMWEYRIPIVVDSNGTARVGRFLEVDVDFTTALTLVGETLALDVDSIRVVRANSAGQVIDANVDFQFDADAGFDPLTNASGEFVIEMSGTALPTDLRHYDIYFDVVGEAFSPYAVTNRLAVSNVADEGQNALQVDTAAGSYFLQDQGASLSSLVDSAGQDWIGYSVATGSAGEYRGVPNLIYPEGEFHPGGTAGSTAISSQGPLRLRVLTSALSDTWGATWSFYDDHVSVTIDYVANDYWFLYEGTPGGLLEPGSDFVTRADGTETLLNQSWNEDLVGEEWVYFGDVNAQRSLFVAAHEDDAENDSYSTLNNEMTVFGFGRSGTTPLLSTAPRTFSLGLMESIDFDFNARQVRSIVTDLGISISPIEVAP
jgi:uncharacterized repeat protein (TIGR02543 family)